MIVEKMSDFDASGLFELSWEESPAMNTRAKQRICTNSLENSAKLSPLCKTSTPPLLRKRLLRSCGRKFDTPKLEIEHEQDFVSTSNIQFRELLTQRISDVETPADNKLESTIEYDESINGRFTSTPKRKPNTRLNCSTQQNSNNEDSLLLDIDFLTQIDTAAVNLKNSGCLNNKENILKISPVKSLVKTPVRKCKIGSVKSGIKRKSARVDQVKLVEMTSLNDSTDDLLLDPQFMQLLDQKVKEKGL